jgi:V8-like Glu-specific endopeptidase
MPALVLDDAREYIFPLFSVDSKDNGILLGSRVFLGTAFFVSKRGDAITANHILPKPEDLAPAKRLVAVVQRGADQQVCWLTHAAAFEQCDLALIHINLDQTRYLQVSDQEVTLGSDVQLIGIPSHEVWLSGKEMRVLKGHVTLVAKQLELNIAVPLGMSGSPVFLGSKVVAYATASVKSEEIEDYTEEVELIADNREQIRIAKVTRVTQYGMAYAFSKLRGHTSPVFEGRTLMQFIEARNNKP